MIRIKNYIFPEENILYIRQQTETSVTILRKKPNEYDSFKDEIEIKATFDDIEWNYGEKENTDLIALKDYVRDNWGENFNKNTTLKEMIERIISRYNWVEEDLQNEADNYKDCIKEKYELEEENKKLKEELELEKSICSNQAQRIKNTVDYVENDMPYLQEPDEEIERCDGTTYMTMKEYDTSILLNKLKGEGNEKNE